MLVQPHLRAVLDDEVLVELVSRVSHHRSIVSVSRFLQSREGKIDPVVAPAGEVAQISADGRGRTAVVQVIAGAHQTIGADTGTLYAVAVTIAVVVHIGKAAKQVTIFVTERADRKIAGTASETRQQVEVGTHVAKLHFEKRIVRPQLFLVPGLTGIKEIYGVDDPVVARIKLAEVDAGGHGQLHRLGNE